MSAVEPRCLVPRHDTRAESPASPRPRPTRLLVTIAALTVVLAGCATSPEAGRVRGEPGADPGNHGNPVVLVAPADEFDRVYYDIPYEGPSVAREDTAQS